MAEHIHQLLQHGYTATVVIYPFKERLTVVESHILNTGGKPTHTKSFNATCIIYNGRIIEENFLKAFSFHKKIFPRNKEEEKKVRESLYWNMTEISKPYQKKKRLTATVSTIAEKFKSHQQRDGSRSEIKELSVIKKEDILFVKNYMAELYRLYRKRDLYSENDEINKISLEESFSKALKKAIVNEESNNFILETGRKVDKNYYVVVVPTDWSDKVAKDILRPIFINAGLIAEDDPPCRLLFVNKLHATLYSFQNCLFDPNNKHWLEYGTLKKNKNYALFEVDFDYYSSEASMNCFLFQTGNANSVINGMEGLKPHNVTNFGKLNLVSISDMKANLLELLTKKKIIPPLSEFLSAKGKIKRFLETLIYITTNYYWISKKNNEKYLINKNEKSGPSSQMSSQYPFQNLRFTKNYQTFPGLHLKALEGISMEDLYNTLFRDNEVNIDKYIVDCSSQYKNITLQGTIIVVRIPSETEHSIHSLQNVHFKEENWMDFKKKYTGLVRGSWNIVEIQKISQGHMNELYLRLLFPTVGLSTEKYFSSTVTDTVEKVGYYKYNDRTLVGDLLSKTKDDVKKALNSLPPSIIQYSKSTYTCILESTERSYPSNLVNIDLLSQRFKYSSFVQINKDLKDEKKIYGGNEIESIISFPSLYTFINIKFLDGHHTNAFLHISQETFNRMLALIKRSAHLQAVLQFFSKYNKSKSLSLNLQTAFKKLFNQSFFKKGEDYLRYSSSSSLFDSFSPEESALLLPMIKELFETHHTDNKENLISVHHPSYIMTFMVLHFIYLQHKIDIHLKENYESTVGEFSYVVSVDRILLDKCLMGSKSTLKEILLASGLTSKSKIRKQLRVISQGECSFPVLQQKANLDLPLKSYYIHAQLYENSIQMSLNQVVVKGNPESTPMTIVVKNNTIAIKHMHELLCDNLWNQIQSNCHQSLCEEHQVDENGNLEEREYSMADRLEFEKTFMLYVKELSTLEQSIEPKRLKIPNDRSFCDCSIYLTHDDIVELSIKPVLKTIVSSILGALTNDQVFGEYYMSALFVTFDSILDSIFHHSYKQVLKSILEKSIKIRLEAKQLEIPNFVLLLNSDINSSVETTRNSTFDSLFAKGSLLQVSSATYLLQFRDEYDRANNNYIKPIVYIKDPKTLKLKRVAKDDTMVKILERGDTLSKEEGNKKTFYMRCLEKDMRVIYVDLFECGPRFSKNSTDADVDYKATQADASLNFAFSISVNLSNYKSKYVPLYVTMKPLGYQSSINMSFEFGSSCNHCYESPYVIDMGDPLTLKNTQYVPQLKNIKS